MPLLVTALATWAALALLAIATLGVCIAYVIRLRRLPDACRYRDLAGRIATKEAELADLTTRLGDARQLIEQSDRARAEMIGAQEWLTANKDKLLTMESERKQQEVLQQQVGALQEELTTKRAELDRVSSERSSAQAAVDALVQQKQDAGDRLEQLRRDHESLARTANEASLALHKVQAEAATAQAHHEALRRDIGALEAELGKARSAKEDLLKAADGIKQNISALKQEERQADVALRAVQKTTEDARGQLAEMQKRLETVSQYHDKIHAESKVLQAKRDGLLAEVENATRAQQAAKSALTEAENRVKEQRTLQEKMVSEVSALRGERDGLIKQVDTLKQLVENLREDIKSFAPGTAEDRYKDLWSPIGFPNLVLSDKVREQEALENTQRHMENVGLQFPMRVLYAFHTALKIADMAPLTVLAGISGTGKSQLPKRYAEGMGMHFSTLAVQPRWDSPQDLFGFFNHLEKRYKATELSRAMIEFERHTWTDWPGDHRRKGPLADHMLLVLLDEMNLARVEYYFSEFLSRLEFRRDIVDPGKDSKKRMAAEIRLDMGAMQGEEREIRLYPDRNILFTGTMNEDESTQTLSDKVLDRACVLRFGRPKDLVTDPATGNTKEPHRTPNGIKFDLWMQWSLAQQSTGSAAVVGEWIGEINGCMDQLHRPFAHRVAQSMMRYAANYPAVGIDEQTRIRFAMADQIEQRILPKLRGLDLADQSLRTPLDRIGKIIAKINDADLMKAYSDCMQGSIFMWRGLDRS